jgi:hypothetical protein
MNRDSLPRTAALVLVISAAFYFAAFQGVEYWRTRKGPWEATFSAGADGRPCLAVSQPFFKLEAVILLFPDESVPVTNLPQTIRFDRPLQTVPWGTVVYQDPTSYPGVVTLNLFGHEVEFMPRVLSLNRRAIAWQSHSTNYLRSADKLPPEKLVRRKYQRETK